MREESPSNPLQSANLRSSIAGVGFQDPGAAYRHWEQIAAQVPSSLAAVLPGLLAEIPDPDSAILLFERLINQSTPLTQQLADEPRLAYYAILVFGHSRYLGEMLFREPRLLQFLHGQGGLHRSFSRADFQRELAEFRVRTHERELSCLLARFKKRAYIRILLRDVLRTAPLAETTAEISALSDVLVEAALREAEASLQRRYGTPMLSTQNRPVEAVPFSVLALGKLGGNELNYSSDIDLLFVHGNGEGSLQGGISHHEYFIRMAQHLTEILSRTSEEGPVFRIDLRLRPQGRDGEVAVSLTQALRYYRETAEDWERQALIKARLSAGDEHLARDFICGVQPVVYRAGIHFAAIKTALVARERMVRHRAKPLASFDTSSIDVKLDHGGIRDIEFLVQCLQRVYGGAEPWLRSSGTLFALQKLHDKQHLSGSDFQELYAAYEFLRHLEHRLQLRFGQQIHRLPGIRGEIEILRRALDRQNARGESMLDIEAEVRRRMGAVSSIYKRIVLQQQAREKDLAAEEQFTLRESLAGSVDNSTKAALDRLATDAPSLYELAVEPRLAPQTRRNLHAFLGAAFTSSARYAALLRHADAVKRLLAIFESSSYLTDVLIRHPEEIATLSELSQPQAGHGSGFLFGAPFEPEGEAGDAVFMHIGGSYATEREKLALLRRHYRHRLLMEGAQDISNPQGVYNSLRAVSAIAEDAIAAAGTVVGIPRNFVVLALGSLGSREFDICSDADLLFVRGSELDSEPAVRSAERIIQALTSYTQDGTVFPVDARLRPRGSEGELAVTIPQLAAYFQGEAKSWEALTYIKLRYITGDRLLASHAIALTESLCEKYAADQNLAGSLREMRGKLEDSGSSSFKTSPGGLYDLDFLTGFLLLRHRQTRARGTLRDRLWLCAELGALDRATAADLDHAGELLRTAQHASRLVTGRPEPWFPTSPHGRSMTARLVSKTLQVDFQDRLEEELQQTQRTIRSSFERLLR